MPQCLQAHTQDLLGQSTGRDTIWWRLWSTLVRVLPSLGSREVLRRGAVTLAFIALARLGAHIPLYGVDLAAIKSHQSGAASAGTHGLVDMASPVPAHIFMLGITPIFAGSIFATVSALFPQLVGAKPKQGAEGVAENALKTRLVACATAIMMAAIRAFKLQPYVVPGTHNFVGSTVLTLTAGAMVLAHVADETEAQGLGNGVTMLIALPMLLHQAQTLRAARAAVKLGMMPAWKAALALAGIAGLVYAALFVSLIELRHETMTHKLDALPEPRSYGRAGAHRSYLPLRISPGGVGALLMASFYLELVLGAARGFGGAPGRAAAAFFGRADVAPLALAAVAFASSAVDFSFGRQTRDLSSWMQLSDVGIRRTPPLVPGEPTRRFLAREQALARLWGGGAVAALAALSFGLDAACTAWIGMPLGATTTLLLTGFLTTAYRQVEALSELPKLSRRIHNEQQLLQNI